MHKDTNHQTAHEMLDEHRDRLARALVECVWLEQRAHDGEVSIAGTSRPTVVLGALRSTLRHAIADCDQLADLIADGETDAADADNADARDAIRASFGDCTVEVRVPNMARPLVAWLQWLQSASAADVTNLFGG
jgi:hypothetical protein